jgi:integration host factor subunit beta
MNKSELTNALAKELDLPTRKSEQIVDTVFDTMTKVLVGDERIEIRGFGSFSVRGYDGYAARNPKTGEETMVEPKKLPFFKTGKEIKERLNRG